MCLCLPCKSSMPRTRYRGEKVARQTVESINHCPQTPSRLPEGARFRVTDSNGKVAGSSNGEFTTGAGGQVLVVPLPPGSYVAEELEAPENYAREASSKTIEIYADGQTCTLEFKNSPYGSLLLKKMDYVTKEPLEGAYFKMTDSSGQAARRAAHTRRAQTGQRSSRAFPKARMSLRKQRPRTATSWKARQGQSTSLTEGRTPLSSSTSPRAACRSSRLTPPPTSP
jgi:hypothetical protein